MGVRDADGNEIKKEYLWSYQKAAKQIKRIEDKIKEIRGMKIYPAVTNDGMPHGTGGCGDLSGYAAKLDETERKYKKARYNRICLFKEITDKIELQENENEKNVLYYRYIKWMHWEDICVRTGYSWKQIHRIHANALKNFKMT